MKEEVIKLLQLQFLEKQMKDVTCDTDDLVKLGETNTMTHDSLYSDEKESLIKKF